VTVEQAAQDILEIKVQTLGPRSFPITLTDVGLGYNQILPVVIQGLLTPPGGLVIFEQPEIHLHPDVQAKLITFFVGLAKAGRRVLVETHSSHLIEHLCLAIAHDQSEEDWLVNHTGVLFVHPPDKQRASAHIEPIEITPYGEILNWPPHFLSDTANLDEEIIRAGFAKRQKEEGSPV
jgi:predicted ATPase